MILKICLREELHYKPQGIRFKILNNITLIMKLIIYRII